MFLKRTGRARDIFGGKDAVVQVLLNIIDTNNNNELLYSTFFITS